MTALSDFTDLCGTLSGADTGTLNALTVIVENCVALQDNGGVPASYKTIISAVGDLDSADTTSTTNLAALVNEMVALQTDDDTDGADVLNSFLTRTAGLPLDEGTELTDLSTLITNITNLSALNSDPDERSILRALNTANEHIEAIILADTPVVSPSQRSH